MRRFDAHALYEALDAQRLERGLRWRQVAGEIRVSPPTLAAPGWEADGMLAMVRWLGRTAESFVRDVS